MLTLLLFYWITSGFTCLISTINDPVSKQTYVKDPIVTLVICFLFGGFIIPATMIVRLLK